MTKILITIYSLIISAGVLAQSKKELVAEAKKLKTEVSQLQDNVDQLQKENTALKTIKPVALGTEREKASYGVGMLIATDIMAQGGDSLEVDNIKAGMSDVFMRNPLKLEDREARGYIQSYLTQAMVKKTQKVKDDGIRFLKENKVKEGIVTTASGLQYKIITSGKGKNPKSTDRVTVNYTGTTIDGQVFDSSLRSGKPITFSVNGVIAGWTEALQLMHEGDKWKIYIPYELGYGERGSGSQIPPYSALIFEIDLIKVE